MVRTLTIALFSAGLLSGALNAADPWSRTSAISNRIEHLKPRVGIAEPTTTYEVQIAEPVPDLLYVLEVRYLEYGSQSVSDWFTFTSAEFEEDLEDAIVWVALHLIAEWRIVEVEPQPEWETVSSHSSYTAAAWAASDWEADGFWARIITRRSAVPTAKVPNTRLMRRK